MGDRANIVLDYGNERFVFLYTHWRGSYIQDILRAALARGKERWDQPSYLARIIFSEMIQDEVLELTGYGIAPYMPDNQHDLLVVDLVNCKVLLCAEEDLNEVRCEWTFEQFVQA